MSAQTTSQTLRLMAERSIYAVRRTDLLQAASEIEDLLFRLEEWRNTFPGKTPQEISLLLAAADFLVKANGKLLAENERLREQRPLTAEEKAWVEKAWQEYRNAEKPAGKDTSLFANILGRDA